MNKSIVLASHLLDEVQKVCSHFAVLRRGKKIYSGSVEEALMDTSSISVSADNMADLKREVNSCKGVNAVEEFADSLRLHLSEDWTVAGFNKYLVERNIEVNYIQQKKSSLEEKFLDILKEDNTIRASTQSLPTV
jgi:ABC-2 type transport system ATP-binding protein